jgi:AcrR family transcriptional regulator
MATAQSIPRGPRGAYAQGRATQETIVDAARTVFADKGFRSGSLRDIAAVAHVTSGTILHHFTSKEDLLVTVLERWDFAFEAIAPARLESGGFVEMASEIVERNSHDREGVTLYMTLLAEAYSPSHPAHDFFVKRYAWLKQTVSSALRAIPETRGLAEAERESLSAAILAVMDGLQVQWLLDESFDMSAAFGSYLASIGLRPAEEENT